MKNFLIVISLIFSISFGSAIANVIDKGFSVLKIDAEFDALKKYLIKITPEELWNSRNADQIGEYITSAWLFDFKLAGIEKYHGLSINRIEVYFDGEYTAEGEIGKQDIFNFTIYLEKPTTSEAQETFIRALEKSYGDSDRWYNPETTAIDRMDWWSEITLLNISLETDVESGQINKYYKADFQQAYGG